MAFLHAGRWGPESFTDVFGNIVPGAKVYVYVGADATVTLATLYADRGKTATVLNPTYVDAAGNLDVFADPGEYTLVVVWHGETILTQAITVPVDPSDTNGGNHIHTLDELTDVSVANPVDQAVVQWNAIEGQWIAKAIPPPEEGITQHNQLGGLSGDDHAHYLTTGRHDAHDHSAALATAALGDLGDVTATAPADGQVLTFDSLNGWQPENLPPGVTDHGALTGLADDDHPHYALTDGTRGAFVRDIGDVMTGGLQISGTGITGAQVGTNLKLKDVYPQIEFEDTDLAAGASGKRYWIHHNSGYLYILIDGNDDGAWDSPHPVMIHSDRSVHFGVAPKVAGRVLVPVGLIQQWPTATPPSGWLICNGAAVSRTSYAELFALIGTTYGAGDGSTTFNLPNLQDRAAVGTNNTNRLLGSAGGAYNHNHGITVSTGLAGAHGHTASTGSAGGHNHSASTSVSTGNAGGHNHSISVGNSGTYSINRSLGNYGSSHAGSHSHGASIGSIAAHAHSASASTSIGTVAAHTHTVAVGNVGDHSHAASGSAGTAANYPPYLSLHYIIKALQ